MTLGAHLQKASFLVAEGNLSKAEAAARDALTVSMDKPGPALRQLADITLRRNEVDEALKWVQQAIVADQGDPWSYILLSSVQQRVGDHAAAIEAGESGRCN